MIARVAALGLGVAGALAFEISRGEIVEIDRDIEIEQAAFALDQCRLDGGSVRMEMVEHFIKRVFFQGVEVGAEEVAERGAAQPSRHGVFGGGRDQAAVAQDAVEFEAAPELVADMDRAGLAMALGGDARGIDFDQRAAAGRPRRRRRRALPAAALFVAPPRPHPMNDVGDFALIGVDEMALTDEGVLDLARQLDPRLARPRAQIAERTNRLLSRSLRGVDGLDQHVIDVDPAVVGANRFADVHVPLYSTKLLVGQHKYSFILVTILKINAFRAGPLKKNQRLASRPKADAVVKSLCKGGSWARATCKTFRPCGRAADWRQG